MTSLFMRYQEFTHTAADYIRLCERNVIVKKQPEQANRPEFLPMAFIRGDKCNRGPRSEEFFEASC